MERMHASCRNTFIQSFHCSGVGFIQEHGCQWCINWLQSLTRKPILYLNTNYQILISYLCQLIIFSKALHNIIKCISYSLISCCWQSKWTQQHPELLISLWSLHSKSMEYTPRGQIKKTYDQYLAGLWWYNSINTRHRCDGEYYIRGSTILKI